MKYITFVSVLFLFACHEKPAVQSSHSTDKAPDKAASTKAAVEPMTERAATSDGWSWIWPKPIGFPVLGIWARSAEEFYGAGDNGVILQYQKGVLRSVESGTRVLLSGVWGSDEGDVFVVGAEGTILRSQGGGPFMKQESGTKARLRAIWGSDSKNIFAVGDGGTMLYFNGVEWKQQKLETTAALSAITGRNINEIYAVGEAGTLLRYDGEGWSLVPTETKAVLYAVGIFGAQIVACGAAGTILRSSDGVTFTQESTSATGTLLTIFAGQDKKSFVVTGPKDIVQFDGKAFNAQTFTGDPLIAAASLKEGGNIFANASGKIFVRQGSQNVEVTQGPRGQFNDIAFDKDGKGTLASDNGIYSWNGTAWVVIEATTGAFWEGVTGAGVGDLAVGPAGLIIRKSASGNWIREESGTNIWLTDAYIAAHADVYVVGHKGIFLKRDESSESWGLITTPTSYAFFGVSGRSAKEVYVVGEAGTIFRYDGKAFQSEVSPIALDLKAVSCEGKEIFAVGKRGTILRRGEAGWVKEESPSTSDLFGVYGLASGEAYAVGERGVILYRAANGTWSKQESDSRSTLLAVAQSASGVIAVGTGGTIMQKTVAGSQ